MSLVMQSLIKLTDSFKKRGYNSYIPYLITTVTQSYSVPRVGRQRLLSSTPCRQSHRHARGREPGFFIMPGLLRCHVQAFVHCLAISSLPKLSFLLSASPLCEDTVNICSIPCIPQPYADFLRAALAARAFRVISPKCHTTHERAHSHPLSRHFESLVNSCPGKKDSNLSLANTTNLKIDGALQQLTCDRYGILIAPKLRIMARQESCCSGFPSEVLYC